MPPICIYCDSQSAIGRVQSSVDNIVNMLMVNLDIFIVAIISSDNYYGVISLDYVRSINYIANPLNRGLNRVN